MASKSYADWMSTLPEELWTQPLNAIAIPGSHDSFTYNLDKRGPLAPSTNNVVKKMAGRIVKSNIYKWSVTQHLDPKQQLQAGNRYFDIRIATKPGSEGCYIVHGLYGTKIDPILADINSFLGNHPKEIVLLDFNHLYDMTTDDHTACMDLIHQVFGDKLCPRMQLKNVSLDFLWQNKYQVITLYHSPESKDNQLFWRKEDIESPWPQQVKTSELLKFLQENYEKGHPEDKFYVTQGVLTPTGGFVVTHLINGSLEKSLANEVAEPVVDWLSHKKRGLPKGINVCILDFVELAEYIPTVVGLNK